MELNAATAKSESTKRTRRWASLLLTATICTSSFGFAAASSAQAAGQPGTQAARVSSSAQASTNVDSLKNAAIGTSVAFQNTITEPVWVGDHRLSPAIHSWPSVVVEGKNGSGDDVSTTIKVGDRKAVKFFGHNPAFSEAYLQFEGQKVFNDSKIEIDGVTYTVRYLVDPLVSYKRWIVSVSLGQRYTHEFVHHTSEDDGVKGTVTNKTETDANVRLGGADLKLTPGQSLLFFDSHGYGWGNRGTRMSVAQSGATGTHFEIADTSFEHPYVKREGQQAKDEYSEGESRSYDLSAGLRLKVTRDDDGKMDVPHENWHTKDWARFTINITKA